MSWIGLPPAGESARLPAPLPRLTLLVMTKSNRSRSVALVLVALVAVLGAACTPPPNGTADARTLLRVDLGAAIHHVDLGADGRVAIVLAGDRTLRVDTSSGEVTDLGVAHVSLAVCEPTCDGATPPVPTPAAVSGDGSTTAVVVAGTWLWVQSDR